MFLVRRLHVRAAAAAALLMLAPLGRQAAAQPALPATDAALLSAPAVTVPAEALRFADSAATADSVRVIAELLEANGAPARRAKPAAEAILKYSRLHALDPLLVVGVIGVENAALAPTARSRAGARGVMQVMPHWKKDIRDCGADLTNIHVNVCFGTRILRMALDETTSVRAALLRYNGCVRAPGCSKYAAAVFSRAGQALVLSRMLAPPRPAMVAAGVVGEGEGSR